VPEAIKSIGVVGAGQMGRGIAQVAAQKGLDVMLLDASPELAQKGKARIASDLEKLVAKSRLLPDEREEILARIKPTGSYGDLQSVDFAVEAATENQNLKQQIFIELDKNTKPGAILASNTSSISITLLSSSTKRPDRVIGMHFMNPVPVMKLVEIIRGIATSDETFEETRALAVAMSKTAVEVNDAPGFVSNRVLMPMINEAIFALYEGVASREAIDEVMKLGMNHPMGPLQLADFIGLDVCLAIMNVLYDGFSDSKYRPCPLLKKYVDAGWLGRKSGRGFYEYS